MIDERVNCWCCAHPFYCHNHIWLSFTKTEFCKSSILKRKVTPIHFRKIIWNVHQHRILIDPKNTLFYLHDYIWLRFIKTEPLLFHSWVNRIELIYSGQIVSFHLKFLNEVDTGSQKMFAIFFAITFWFSLALKWNLTLSNDNKKPVDFWACLIFDLSKT